MECLFCSWLEKKNQILWENENIVVFVANLAFTEGHVLVVPKKHVESIFEIDEKLREELFFVSLKMGKLLDEKLKIGGYTLALNEKVYLTEPDDTTHIPHVHMHIIPRRKNEYPFSKGKRKLTEKEVKELISILKS